MEIHSLVDKMYGGLDVQARGGLLYGTDGDARRKFWI